MANAQGSEASEMDEDGVKNGPSSIPEVLLAEMVDLHMETTIF